MAVGGPLARRIVTTAGPAAAVVALQVVVFPAPTGVQLSGAILGLLGALGAVGLALVWRANRVVNFAQGDLGAFPATLSVLLVTVAGLPWLVGVLAGLAVAVVVGVVVDVLVVRRFARAPRLGLTVATIGVAQLLAFSSLLLPRAWGEGPAIRSLPVPFEWSARIGGLAFDANDLVAAVVAISLLVAVAVLLRATDTGTAVRAAADRGDLAMVLGIPVRRLEAQVWMVAAGLSFASVLLTAGVAALPFGAGLGLVVLLRALAALVLGRMTDLPAVALTAVALGVLEAGIRWNEGDELLVAPILAALIVASLVLQRRGDRRAERDDTSTWRASADVRPVPSALARLRRVRLARWAAAVAGVAAAVLFPLVLGTNGQLKAGVVVVFATVGTSVVVLTGWAGQVSLGQMSFVGAGAAVGAVVMDRHGWDPFSALLLAAVVGASVAVVVGLPALRLRGLYLAITTLALALAASSWVFSNRIGEWIPEGSFARPALFRRIALDSPLRRYYLALAVLAAALVLLTGVRRGRTGRVLVAVRDGELGAAAFGISPTRAKLTAFATSGAVAAAAGVVLVLHQGAFRPVSYEPTESVAVFVATVIGGIGALGGAVLGALVQRGAQWLLPSPWSALVTGVGVLVVLVVLPEGLAGAAVRVRDRVVAALAGRDHHARHVEGAAPSEVVGGSGDGDGDLPPADAPMGGGDPATTPPRRPAGSGTSPQPLLSVRGLRAGYDGTEVLHGVDLEVGPGEVVALLGTNGAGKSTLLRTISGVVRAGGGTVHVDGREVTGLQPAAIAALGVAHLPGGAGTFPSLTVRENLRAAAWLLRSGPDRAAGRRRGAVRTDDVLDLFPVLRGRLDDPAADLSGGQQQMLALAMALLSEPRLLLVDELSLGLAPLVVAQLTELVDRVAAAGTGVLVVEQSVNVALTMARSATFLERGQVRFCGPADELLDAPDLLRAVFLAGPGVATDGGDDSGVDGGGGDVEGGVPDASAPSPGPVAPPAGDVRPALELRGVTRHFGGISAVSDVDLVVAPGEIVGLIGSNGAGKTTLFDLVCGHQPLDGGRVVLGGRDVSRAVPAARARSGLGRTFQGGRLFAGLTVAEALAVALDRSTEVRDPLNAALRLPAHVRSEDAVAERVAELLDVFGLAALRDAPTTELSTGTRRVVELAGAVAHQPDVLLLDEPAAGLAQREVEALGDLLLRIRRELGCAMVLVEHDMPLVAKVADRLVALEAGTVIAQGPPQEVLANHLVVASYLGNDPRAVARSGSPGAGPTRAVTP